MRNFATAVPVSGPLTDAQLRATAVPVSGPLTNAELRATAVPVSGTITSNDPGLPDTLGQKTMAGSTSVVLASDQKVIPHTASTDQVDGHGNSGSFWAAHSGNGILI